MVYMHGVMRCSLLAALIVMATAPTDAAIRVGNKSRSYAAAYNQVNTAQANNNAQNPNVNNAAVAVSGPNMAPRGAYPAPSGDVPPANDSAARTPDTGAPNDAMMARCAAIYPSGQMEWDVPTIGPGAGGEKTCVANVTLYGYQMGAAGANAELARGKLAAGAAVKCNISSFPESGWLPDADSSKVTFPHDTAPTMDDVIAVMDREQKQNAGIKIAAAAVVGALGGNIAGKPEVGNDSLFGTGKDKMQGTLVGALGGAGLMAASSYTGKVTGDTILSAGVNAAAGGVVGNIMATGNSVLRVEECRLPGNAGTSTCLWGMLVTKKDLASGKTAFFNKDNETTVVCDTDASGAFKNCSPADLVSIQLDAFPNKSIDDLKTEKKLEQYMCSTGECFTYKATERVVEPGAGDSNGVYLKISSAGTPDRSVAAMITGISDKSFGIKKSDWSKLKGEIRKNSSKHQIYGRNAQGEGYELTDKSFSIDDFQPITIDAEDGAIIDLNNKARMKSTLTGAGVGGALGAFVGYQGAQDDVTNRWTAAVREYNDSLQKFYCQTGSRYMGAYNSMIDVPALVMERDTVSE